MKGFQITTASLMALMPAYTNAFRYYISEYNSVNCNPVDNSCTPMLNVVLTNNDDSCDTIKNSKDNKPNGFEQGGEFKWEGTDKHDEFSIHFSNHDDWWKEDVGREAGTVDMSGNQYKLTVHKGRSCEDLYPFSTRFVRRILTFSDE
jgi:hypothetical protein